MKNITMFKSRVTVFIMVVLFVFISISVQVNAAMSSELLEKRFKDVSKHWAASQIFDLVEKGIVNGIPLAGGKFAIYPDKGITRAEYVAVLVKSLEFMNGTVEKKTTQGSDKKVWYKDLIDNGVAKGLISGYPDGTIKPLAVITRAEMVQMTVKAFNLDDQGNLGLMDGYDDVTNSDWFFNSALICKNIGLIKGFEDDNFMAKQNATRAEAFTVIANCIRLFGNNANPNKNLIKSLVPVKINNTQAKSPLSLNESEQFAGIKKIVKDFSKTPNANYSIGFMDLETGVEILENDAKMKPASMIKLFVMVEAYGQINEGKVGLNSMVQVTPSDKVSGSGTLQYLSGTFKRSVSELIFKMIAESDNTATNLLIDELGIENINATIRNMGFKNTYLGNKLNLKKRDLSRPSNSTSVSDLVKLFGMLYRGDCVSKKFDNEMISILKKQKFNEKIPKHLGSGVSVAHKTGELLDVENDGGIIFSPKGAYVLCVLSNNVDGTGTAVKKIAGVSKNIYDMYCTLDKNPSKSAILSNNANTAISDNTTIKTTVNKTLGSTTKSNIGVSTSTTEKKDSESKNTANKSTEKPTTSIQLQGIIICIDPGHQQTADTGRDLRGPGASADETSTKVGVGTIGVSTKIPEYVLTLEVGKKLKTALQKLGAKVIMTRETNNVNISNRNRAIMANEAGADAVVSIHADAFDKSSVTGFSILNPGNKYIKDRKIVDASKKLAQFVNKELDLAEIGVNRGLFERNDLPVLNWSKETVIIVELGFMTNPKEDKKMNTKEYQEKFIKGIVDGLVKFFKPEKTHN